jgi:predicted DNA-binding protein
MGPETKTIEQAKTSIKIKPDTWKEAKIEAIREGKTVSELVEEAIEAWIRDRKKRA